VRLGEKRKKMRDFFVRKKRMGGNGGEKVSKGGWGLMK
jgi:hypothetical protein